MNEQKSAKKLINSAEKRRLFTNFTSLSILQFGNYLLPLITFPYLVRVLGVEKFGLISFAVAFINYFIIITDYGFNLSATREIALMRSEREKVSALVTAVLLIKLLLFLISFICFLLIVFSFPKFSQDWAIFLISFGMVLGQVLFPIWLFQGLEQMVFITIFTLLGKVFFTVLIFIFVQRSADFLLVPLINSLSSILTGGVALYYAYKKFSLRVRTDLLVIKNAWQTSTPFFLSHLAISAYTISTPFLLGLLAGNQAVGYFSGAEKIVLAFRRIYTPLSQVLYPFISAKMNDNQRDGWKIVKKVSGYVSAITFFISALIFFGATTIVKVILGENYLAAIPVLKIIALLPFLISLSNLAGIQFMLPLKMEREFLRIVFVAGFINLLLCLFLIPGLKENGAAWAMLLTETLVTLTMVFCVNKKRKENKLC